MFGLIINIAHHIPSYVALSFKCCNMEANNESTVQLNSSLFQPNRSDVQPNSFLVYKIGKFFFCFFLTDHKLLIIWKLWIVIEFFAIRYFSISVKFYRNCFLICRIITDLKCYHIFQWEQLRIEDHFGFRTFSTKFCFILKYGINLKFENIVQIFRKIIQLNAVIIL